MSLETQTTFRQQLAQLFGVDITVGYPGILRSTSVWLRLRTLSRVFYNAYSQLEHNYAMVFIKRHHNMPYAMGDSPSVRNTTAICEKCNLEISHHLTTSSSLVGTYHNGIPRRRTTACPVEYMTFARSFDYFDKSTVSKTKSKFVFVVLVTVGSICSFVLASLMAHFAQ